MRKKLLSLLLLFLLINSTTVFAVKNEDAEVKPNIYEEKEVNINPSYGNNLEQKEQLSEEQKQLTFEKPKETGNQKLKEQLFQSSVIETNTIKSKSSQLSLFSDGNTPMEAQKEVKQQTDEGTSTIILLLLIIVLVIIVGLFLLIVPKLRKNHAS
ncbi:type VII secretion protein EssA [Virgibacillus necropolis]|uniref:Type VII secretion protein EssA n=1 Tax=Virgibacillus necropolis TaxID=163877 RepID=A0A221MEN3_9BACI|nr:type VII secretion protein EssA [Virgibacillus necropolis]ASN06082.1 type VII secretion protein EssA [Virgibacillus necropolis]